MMLPEDGEHAHPSASESRRRQDGRGPSRRVACTHLAPPTAAPSRSCPISRASPHRGGTGNGAPKADGPARMSFLADEPLERPNPPAQLVLRYREYSEIGRAPLKELTAQLLELIPDSFFIFHLMPMLGTR